jgi:hypothetical protein
MDRLELKLYHALRAMDDAGSRHNVHSVMITVNRSQV